MKTDGLRREIRLGGAVAYGVGLIVGAGVYTLIGVAAGGAGNAVWLSFAFTALIASLTGLSYARLASQYTSSGAEYVYVREAFSSRFWAFIVGWLVILSSLLSCATVALAFGGYLGRYVGLPAVLSAMLIILILFGVNYLGIRESVRAYVALTAVQIFGIILVILLALPHLGSVNYLDSPSGFKGIVSTVAIVFFAFLGFEGLAKIGEETEDPQRTIPRALIIALTISTFLYILLAIAVVSVVPYGELAASGSPLTEVVSRTGFPSAASIMSLIALIATGNSVLLIQLATSRIIYGIAKEGSLPKVLKRIHPTRGTPWVASIFAMAASALFTLLQDIEVVVSIANSTIFLVFFAVNASLIRVEWNRSRTSPDKPFPSKRLILPILGAVSTLLLLTQFDAFTIASTVGLIAVGALIYGLMRIQR